LDRKCNRLLFYPAFSPTSRVVSAKANRLTSAPLRSSDHSTFDYVLNFLGHQPAAALPFALPDGELLHSLSKFLERGQEVSHELVFQSAKLFYEVG
jgi:hypothetical protein